MFVLFEVENRRAADAQTPVMCEFGNLRVRCRPATPYGLAMFSAQSPLPS